MKTIKLIKSTLFLLSILMSTSIFAQTHDPENAPYVGTWQYQNGNSIFSLTIWEDDTVNPYDNKYYLHGNYEMTQIVGTVRPVVYTSNPYKAPDWRSKLTAFDGLVWIQEDGSKLVGGQFKENHKGGSGLYGRWTISKTVSCSGCPEKINWKVTFPEGLQYYNGKPPLDFTIPNNIELTKVP